MKTPKRTAAAPETPRTKPEFKVADAKRGLRQLDTLFKNVVSVSNKDVRSKIEADKKKRQKSRGQ